MAEATMSAPVPILKPRKTGRAREIENVILNITPPNLFSQVKFDIAMETKSARNLFEMLEKGLIVIDPDMQRKYVWDIYTASRFIESIIFRLPIPPIILEEREDKYYVIDGVQRLTTIYLFMTDRLRLRRTLTPALEGKTYSKLPKPYRDRLDHFSTIPIMRIKIISPDFRYRAYATLELFRRINFGMVPLTPGQILFCAMTSPVVRYVKVLANSQDFSFLVNENDLRNFAHCVVAAAMMETLHRDRIDIVPLRCDREILRFLAETDENTAKKLYEKAQRLIQVWKKLGITRDDLCPATYKLSASKAPSRAIVQLLTYVTKPLIDGKAEVKIDIKKIMREKLTGNRKIGDKTLRELYMLRSRNRDTLLRVLREIADEVRSEIERAR